MVLYSATVRFHTLCSSRRADVGAIAPGEIPMTRPIYLSRGLETREHNEALPLATNAFRGLSVPLWSRCCERAAFRGFDFKAAITPNARVGSEVAIHPLDRGFSA